MDQELRLQWKKVSQGVFHKSKGVQRKSQNIIDPKRVGQMTKAWGTCLSNSLLAAAGDVADVALPCGAEPRSPPGISSCGHLWHDVFLPWFSLLIITNSRWQCLMKTHKNDTFVQKVHDRVWDVQVQKATIMSLQVVCLQVLMEAATTKLHRLWIKTANRIKVLHRNFK